MQTKVYVYHFSGEDKESDIEIFGFLADAQNYLKNEVEKFYEYQNAEF